MMLMLPLLAVAGLEVRLAASAVRRGDKDLLPIRILQTDKEGTLEALQIHLTSSSNFLAEAPLLANKPDGQSIQFL